MCAYGANRTAIDSIVYDCSKFFMRRRRRRHFMLPPPQLPSSSIINNPIDFIDKI